MTTTATTPQAPPGPPPAAPGATAQPAVRNRILKQGLGYLFEPVGQTGQPLGVRIRADYLKERSDEFSAELTFESTLPGFPPHLHQTRINLSSTPTKEKLAKYLGVLIPETRVPWTKLVEQFCVAVVRREREGEPVMMVGRMPTQLRARDQIERLIAGSKPSIWYGPGGAAKGWMAVKACVCVAAGVEFAGLKVRQGRPLYLDWEDSPFTLDERVKAVAKGMGLAAPPEFAYRKCRRTITKDLNTIMRMIDECRADFIVIDSVGLAGGAAGEGTYENVALALFEAIRLFEPRTVLLIDHVSGAGLGDDAPLAGKAFGSVYKMYEARAAFEVRSQQEPDQPVTHTGFYHTKHNHTVKYGAMGFRVEFGPTPPDGGPPETVTITREDVRDNNTLSKALSVQEQIGAYLRRGVASVKDIAQGTGIPEGTVRVKLNAFSGRKFYKTQTGDWGLIDTIRQAPPDPFAGMNVGAPADPSQPASVRAPHLHPVPAPDEDDEEDGVGGDFEDAQPAQPVVREEGAGSVAWPPPAEEGDLESPF